MNQIKNITNFSLLILILLTVSACGTKRFTSDDASSVRGTTGTIDTPPTTDDGGPTPGTFLTSDQCFIIYDVWGINNPRTLNNVAWTSNDDCAQASAASVAMNFGAPRAVSYALYHTTPAQSVALVAQVTGVQQPTDDTVRLMDPALFKEALVNSNVPAFARVAGLYDEYF